MTNLGNLLGCILCLLGLWRGTAMIFRAVRKWRAEGKHEFRLGELLFAGPAKWREAPSIHLFVLAAFTLCASIVRLALLLAPNSSR